MRFGAARFGRRKPMTLPSARRAAVSRRALLGRAMAKHEAAIQGLVAAREMRRSKLLNPQEPRKFTISEVHALVQIVGVPLPSTLVTFTEYEGGREIQKTVSRYEALQSLLELMAFVWLHETEKKK